MKKFELIEEFFGEVKRVDVWGNFSGLDVYHLEGLKEFEKYNKGDIDRIEKILKFLKIFKKNNINISDIIEIEVNNNNNNDNIIYIQKYQNKIYFDISCTKILPYVKIETADVITEEELKKMKLSKIRQFSIFECFDFIKNCLKNRIEEINEYINFLNSEVEE